MKENYLTGLEALNLLSQEDIDLYKIKVAESFLDEILIQDPIYMNINSIRMVEYQDNTFKIYCVNCVIIFWKNLRNMQIVNF